MTNSKPVLRRAQAQKDIANAVAYYLEQAAPNAAEGFITALEKTIGHISRHSKSGSPCYAGELNLPDLRFWQIKRYPYLLFYVERNDHIDVWRLLHSQSDVPAWLREPE